MTLPEGLALRAPEASDVAALHEMLSRPGTRRGTLRLPYMDADWVAQRVKPAPNTHSVVGVIDGRAISWATLVRYDGRRSHSGDVSICVHDDFAGRGIGRTTLSAVIDIADNWLGLTRLVLEVYADNVAAIRLYESLGFEREGLLRANSIRDGVLVDALVMGRLREPLHAEGSER